MPDKISRKTKTNLFDRFVDVILHFNNRSGYLVLKRIQIQIKPRHVFDELLNKIISFVKIFFVLFFSKSGQ